MPKAVDLLSLIHIYARVLKFESVDQPAEDEEGSFTPAVITDWREVPLQALERKELREQLQRAIASLPEIYREVLLLRDVEEFNIAETAAALGVSEGVVKTRLLRARLMMQKIDVYKRQRFLPPAPPSRLRGQLGRRESAACRRWFAKSQAPLRCTGRGRQPWACLLYTSRCV